MNELVVNGQIAITSNFEELKSNLSLAIKDKYSIAVTDDSVKDAKKVMADINKDKSFILDNWKNKKKELEAPIKEMDSKVKELASLFDEARGAIGNQVEIFEAGKRNQAVEACKEYATSLLAGKGLEGFNLEQLNTFNNLTYITEAGTITAIAKQAVESLVNNFELEILRAKQAEAERILKEQEIKARAIEEFKKEQEAMQAMQSVQAEVKHEPVKEPEKKMPDILNNFLNKNKNKYRINIELEVLSAKSSEEIYNFILSSVSETLRSAVKNIEINLED